MKTIRALIICTLAVMLHGWLAGCRTARSAPDRAAGTALTQPYTPTSAAPDSAVKPLARLDSVVVTPHRSLVDKVLGRTPLPSPLSQKEGAPRIGKKSTVSIYYGPATVTTNTAAKNATAGTGATGGKAGGQVAGAGAELTNIEKAKAPVATGTGDATDQTRAQASANIKGDGNAPVLSNTAPEAPGIGATIASNLTKPLGIVVALAVVGLLVYGAWRYKSTRV